MTDSKSNFNLAPLASPLQALPEGELLTEDQWTMLLAICDTVVSPFSHQDASVSTLRKYLPDSLDQSVLNDYLSETASSHPLFKQSIHRRFALYIPPASLKALSFILSSLNTRLGSLFLTSSMTPFHLQPLSTRTAIFSSWATARLPLFRSLFQSFSGLAKQTWLELSPTLPQLMSFPETPAHVERNNSFKFDFKQFESSDEPVTLSTGVIIVGSGCGAGVCAL